MKPVHLVTDGLQSRVAQLRSHIREIDPSEAQALQHSGAVLIDVREADEIAQGTAPGALRLGRGFLELRIEQSAERNSTVILMCGSGTRSLFSADDLVRMGYQDVRSMSGGFSRWKQEGRPIEIPPRIDPIARERYARHLLIPEIGEAGQEKLMNAKVLLIGAGGLGSPAGYYLAAAGVGTIGLIDHDVVDRSNLQRQILHSEASLGMSKVASARMTLKGLNPSVNVIGHEERLTSTNVEQLVRGYQVVVDGSDNFPTRYLVNDACVNLGLPHVYGAVHRFDGEVGIFWPKHSEHSGPCYRCLHPEPPPAGAAPSCAEAGVLGVLPGTIGLIQATETIKLLLGIGEPLVGRILHYDALRMGFHTMRLPRNPACPCCGDDRSLTGYMDYDLACAAARP
ncbi:Molybdopterin-synthase adenylyltransferase [Pandoraea iniqua]|uniref:Molybdopterin-synthase adenylyltransferase n=1 Tax=Pandoraea iniqua TaxID=2508288 RepID=A0A5E4YG94_9BURK|nr:molybdopterin-synthase adenylyltransferase MoeB [Pandoraea iniqua]VVE47385.1 Molybdopterin-synthase adenylyltransferase [Pandoraea iniqua]